MDKLEPVLAQKFWIIAGVALLLPSYGWWSASTSLHDETQTRTQQVDGAFGRIPKDGQVEEIPNKKWTAEVAKLNKIREQQNKEAAAVLWETQKKLMFWPDDIASDIAAAGYRGEIPDNRRVVRSFYRQSYPEQIRKLRSIVEPISPTNPDGLVQMAQGILTQVPVDRWDQLPPTVEEMWDAQEDIWLQTALLDTIAEINQDATSIIDAPIKFIRKLELRGGDRKSANAGPAGRTAKSQRGNRTSRPQVRSGLRGLGGRRSQTALTATNVDFAAEAEFGKPPQGSAVDDGSGGFAGRYTYEPDEEEDDDIVGVRRVEKDEGPQVVRYVDDGSKTPYKTRAFYLKVIMDEREIPAFLTELTNSPWPVEIVRVHRVSLRKTQEADQLRSRAQRGQQNRGSQNKGNTVNDNIKSALSDHIHLSSVVVGGLLTLYNPVDQPKAKAGQARPAEGEPATEAASDAAATPESANTAEPDTSATTESENGGTSPSPEESTPEAATPPAASETEDSSANQPESQPAGGQP